MYAVVVTGGKQYRVTAGDTIEVEKLEGVAGDILKIDQVLNLSDGGKVHVGTPMVKDAIVMAEIIDQIKGDKVLIFKKKRRHNYRRKNGHRQRFTVLHITEITLGGTSLMKADASKKPKAVIKSAPVKKTAEEKKAASVKKAAAPKKAPAAKKPAAAKKQAAKKAKA